MVLGLVMFILALSQAFVLRCSCKVLAQRLRVDLLEATCPFLYSIHASLAIEHAEKLCHMIRRLESQTY